MTDEAREARRLPPHISEADVVQITELVAPVIAKKAYDAGVAEGIRQAREAVVTQQQTEPWASAMHYYPSDPLDAIDALSI